VAAGFGPRPTGPTQARTPGPNAPAGAGVARVSQPSEAIAACAAAIRAIGTRNGEHDT
jgi:hypothetical protein